MSNRPSIPADVKREVLHEARHKCAVCGHALSLEMAHIFPWRQTKDHSAENLIALCPTCHSQADSEDWGADYLRRYKKTPYALEMRRPRPTTPTQQAAVDLILGVDPETLDLHERFKILKQVAVFLEIPLQDIDLLEVRRTNSSRVTLGLPEKSAYRLYDSFLEGDRRLSVLLGDLLLLAVNEPTRIGRPVEIFASPGYPKIQPRIPLDGYVSYGSEQLIISDNWTGEPVGYADLRFEVSPGRLKGNLNWFAERPISDPDAYIRFQISILGDAGQVIHQSRMIRIDPISRSGPREFSMDMPRYVARRAAALSAYILLVSRRVRRGG